MKYKNYNDYELIYMVREKDEFSYNKLFEKYRPIIKRISFDYFKRFSNYGFDIDDFYQEAYLAFHRSIISFDEEKDILFYTFCIMCIRRSLSSFCNKITNKKNSINNNIISIDEKEDIGSSNIDSYNEYEESINILRRLILSLDFEDSCILEMRYNGFSCSEIATLLDMSIRHVYFKYKKIKKIIFTKYLLKNVNI